jgi:hypothetical protein
MHAFRHTRHESLPDEEFFAFVALGYCAMPSKEGLGSLFWLSERLGAALRLNYIHPLDWVKGRSQRSSDTKKG